MKIFLKTSAVVLSCLVVVFGVLYFSGAFNKISAASFSRMIEKKLNIEDASFLFPENLEDINKKLSKTELSELFKEMFKKENTLSGNSPAKKADAEKLLFDLLGEEANTLGKGNKFCTGESLQNKRIEGNLLVIADNKRVELSSVVATGKIIVIANGEAEIFFKDKTTANGGVIVSSLGETRILNEDAGILDISAFGKIDIEADLTGLIINEGAEINIKGDIVKGEILGGKLSYNEGQFNKLSFSGSSETVIERAVSGNSFFVSGEKSKLNFSGSAKVFEVSAKDSLVNIKGGSEIGLLNITEMAERTTVMIEKAAETEKMENAGIAAVIDNRSKWDGRI